MHLLPFNNRDFREVSLQTPPGFDLDSVTQCNQKSIHSSTLWAWWRSARRSTQWLWIIKFEARHHWSTMCTVHIKNYIPESCRHSNKPATRFSVKYSRFSQFRITGDDHSLEWDQHKCTYVAVDILINRPKLDLLPPLFILNHASADVRKEERKEANEVPKEEETEKVIVVAVPQWWVSVCVCQYEHEEGPDRTKRMCLVTQMTRDQLCQRAGGYCTHTHTRRQTANDPCLQNVLLFAANTNRPAGGPRAWKHFRAASSGL